MRNSYNGSFIFGNDGLIGINLGSDYCSEHEWGLRDLGSYLGINPEAGFGLARRKTNQAKHLNWIEYDKVVGFSLHRWYSEEDRLNWKPRDGFSYSDKAKSFYAGWSGTSLRIFADKPTKKIKSEKTIERIKLIYEALSSINAVIWLGGGGVFENAGLCIGILDKMPKDIFDNWEKVDEERFTINAAFELTGIKKILTDAGKRYFCLDPAMHNGKLKAFLNPEGQAKYNSGWFSIEELKLWAKDQGPIMKNKTK